jgi:hypothetical protein
MPTSQLRRIGWRPKLGESACYETPTGWKFFGNLLDAEEKLRSVAKKALAPVLIMCVKKTVSGR